MTKTAKPWKRSRWHCRKCGSHTRYEYFMVDDALWQGVVDRWKIPADAHGDVGMICVNCFEQLLGRKLTKDDFSDAEINHLDCEWNLRSDRLCDRLTVD